MVRPAACVGVEGEWMKSPWLLAQFEMISNFLSFGAALRSPAKTKVVLGSKEVN